MEKFPRIISPSSAEFRNHMSVAQMESGSRLLCGGARMWGIQGDQIDPNGKCYKKLKSKRGHTYSRSNFEAEVLRRSAHLLREEEAFMKKDYPEIRERVVSGLQGVTEGFSHDQIDERLSQFACHLVDPWVIDGLGDISVPNASIRVALSRSRRVMRTTLAHELVHAAMGKLVFLDETGLKPMFWLLGDDLLEGIAMDAEQFIMGQEHDGFCPYKKEFKRVRRIHNKVSSRVPLYTWAMTDYEPENGFGGLFEVRRSMKYRLTRTLAEIQAQAS